MAELATIDVHGFDVHGFIRALQDADVGLVLDIRQRRGVRSSQYAWANAKRLQVATVEARFGHSHLPELAPTTEMRQLQYAEEERKGEGKRSRSELAPGYVQSGPEACHRSLVAERLDTRARDRGHAPEATRATPSDLETRGSRAIAPRSRSART